MNRRDFIEAFGALGELGIGAFNAPIPNDSQSETIDVSVEFDGMVLNVTWFDFSTHHHIGGPSVTTLRFVTDTPVTYPNAMKMKGGDFALSFGKSFKLKSFMYIKDSSQSTSKDCIVSTGFTASLCPPFALTINTPDFLFEFPSIDMGERTGDGQ